MCGCALVLRVVQPINQALSRFGQSIGVFVVPRACPRVRRNVTKKKALGEMTAGIEGCVVLDTDRIQQDTVEPPSCSEYGQTG